MRWLIQAPIQLWLLGCTWKPCEFGAPLFHHISWQQASIFRNPELAGCIAASQVFFSAAVQICGVAGNLVQLPGARIPALEGRTSRVHQCWLVRGVRCIMQISVLVKRLMPSMFRCWFLARTHMAFFISLCRSGCCMDRSRRKRLNLCLGKTSHAVALSTSIVNLPPCIYGLGAGSLLHAPAVIKSVHVAELSDFPFEHSTQGGSFGRKLQWCSNIMQNAVVRLFNRPTCKWRSKFSAQFYVWNQKHDLLPLTPQYQCVLIKSGRGIAETLCTLIHRIRMK